MEQTMIPTEPTSPETDAAGDLRHDAQKLGSTAASRLHSEVDARKGAAVSQAQSVSSAITQTAEGLGEGSPEWLKSALRQGAQQIQRFADTIEQKDSRQMMSEVQNFARNSPGTFLAACGAIGFAAARVLKAGGEQQQSKQPNETAPFRESSSFVQSQSLHNQPDTSRAVEPAYGSSAGGFGAGTSSPGGLA